MVINQLLLQLKGGLIVSCQPDAHDRLNDPMNSPMIMAAMARSAELGGAVGVRADGEEDIAAIRAAVHLPIIGIMKADLPGFDVRITPTLEHALKVITAGADIIALDATSRPRLGGFSAVEFIRIVKNETRYPVFADISTLNEGIAAEEAGADAILTTLSGYVSPTTQRVGPDFELIYALSSKVSIPVIAEGRIKTPQEAGQALACGAWAVTVGSAITRPRSITERFVFGLKGFQH